MIRFSVDQAGFDNRLRLGTINPIAGWARARDPSHPITHVDCSVRQAVVGRLPIRQERPDLRQAFGEDLYGFAGVVHLDEALAGEVLRLEAVANDGSRFLLQEYPLVDLDRVTEEERQYRRQHRLPDDLLIHLVVHSVDPDAFLRYGKQAAELLLEVLEAHGARGQIRRVLDFGVGCGRVARWWKELGVEFELHGTDINDQLVAWCRENIIGTFHVNPLHPPTQFADGRFDLVYAFSVFTHLTADTQREWRDELRRIVAPGGYVVLTTHGDGHAAGLAEPSREDYARDGFVVVSRQAEGENLCATYQTREWTERLLGEAFDIVAFRPSAHPACGNQDLYLLRKAAGAGV